MFLKAIIQEFLPLYVQRKDEATAVKDFKYKQSYPRGCGRDPSTLPSYPKGVADIHLFAVIPAASGAYPSPIRSSPQVVGGDPSERNPRWMPD